MDPIVVLAFGPVVAAAVGTAAITWHRCRPKSEEKPLSKWVYDENGEPQGPVPQPDPAKK